MNYRDLKTIWQVPKYLPYLQPTLTEDILRRAEEQLGHKLPDKYIDLINIQNGGYIRFTIKDVPHREIRGIGPNFPSITDFDWADYNGTLSFELEGLIPFDGDGHWFICFDYRKHKTSPAITFIDESQTDKEKVIAETFEKYLDLLELETEGQYVIETNLSIEETTMKISQIASINFEMPDLYAHGYPVYRARYKDAWIWVSPNKVPSGFVRTDDVEYEELKSGMAGMSLRYPEIPENNLLIQVSDEEERMEIFKILENNFIEIRSFQGFL